MCDRPVPQQNLCAELAGLIDVLPDEAVGPWLAAFWETLGREWTGIDVYRMEKFLLLVRRVLAAVLAWVCAALPEPASAEKDDDKTTIQEAQETETKASKKAKKKSRDRIDAVLENLADWPFETEDNLSKMPPGLRLHVLDIWVDEVEKLGLLDAEKTGESGRQFLDRLGLLIEAQTRSTCKPVRLRAKDTLADDRLPWNAGESGNEDVGKIGNQHLSNDKDSWDGFDD